MKYVTGMQALNIQCPLDTTGDWHPFTTNWDNLHFQESDDNPLKDFGIYKTKIPLRKDDKEYFVADHIRACLDMLQNGDYFQPEGMRKDYLDDDPKFDKLVFPQVVKLSELDNFDKIVQFFEREYKARWFRFAKSQGGIYELEKTSEDD